MTTYQFKTNINCSGCIAKITPLLDGYKDILTWRVDIANPGKTLTVETDLMDKEQVKEVVEKAGFKAESV